MTLIAGRRATMSPSTIVQPDPRAYVRIAAMVREMISSQILPPGSPGPSITRLCREHGHARQTCGRAMRLLEDEGLLHRVPGLGYYVTCRAR
jgi:DNA-binding GntR family transcriptional regulator